MQSTVKDDQHIIETEKEKVKGNPIDAKKEKGNNVNKLTDNGNENENENEEEEDEVTRFAAIVNELYYKATSTNILLLPFMSVTQDCMSVIPTLQAKYL